MKFIANRSFVLVKPKEPFVKWVNGYDTNIIPEENVYSCKTLYMLSSVDNISTLTIENLIKTKYKDIFINELWAWYEDEEYLPKNISFELFKDWFNYEFIEMCFDTLHSKIIVE